MSQPQWKLAGHVGDIDPIAFGGGFVYVDETGVYPPEMTYFEPAPDEEWHKLGDKVPVQIYRVVLDPPRFKTLTEAGKRQLGITRAKDLPTSDRNVTWYWYNEWYVKYLPKVAESCGDTAFNFLRALLGKNPIARALVYESMIHYFGIVEFDSCPIEMPQDVAYTRYADEMAAIRGIPREQYRA